MTELDRRSFLTTAIASLGLAATCAATAWPAFAQAVAPATRQRIDIHHHFAPPAWVAEVKGRPLLQAANTTWTPARVDRGHGPRRRRRRGGVHHQPRPVVRRRGGDEPARARVQRVRRKAGAGSSEPLRPVRRHAAARRRCHVEGDRVRVRHAQGPTASACSPATATSGWAIPRSDR